MSVEIGTETVRTADGRELCVEVAGELTLLANRIPEVHGSLLAHF